MDNRFYYNGRQQRFNNNWSFIIIHAFNYYSQINITNFENEYAQRELNSVELSLRNVLAKISQKTEEEILKDIMNNKKNIKKEDY